MRIKQKQNQGYMQFEAQHTCTCTTVAIMQVNTCSIIVIIFLLYNGYSLVRAGRLCSKSTLLVPAYTYTCKFCEKLNVCTLSDHPYNAPRSKCYGSLCRQSTAQHCKILHLDDQEIFVLTPNSYAGHPRFQVFGDFGPPPTIIFSQNTALVV